LGSGDETDSARIAWRWLHDSSRSFLLVPFRNLVPGSGFPHFDVAITSAGDNPLSIGGEGGGENTHRYVLQ
jgi:hypothetical protein